MAWSMSADREADLRGVGLDRRLAEIGRQRRQQPLLLLDEQAPQLAQLGDPLRLLGEHTVGDTDAQAADRVAHGLVDGHGVEPMLAVVAGTIDLHLDEDELVVVRGLRAVPAALPDVPGHGRGGALTARTHRRDARRAVARGRSRRRVRALHGDVRAVPWLRAGVPERGSLRPPHGGHPHRLGRRASHRTAVASSGLRRARPPPHTARRILDPGRGPAVAAGAAAGRARSCPAASRSGRAPDGRGRVAVHRLRDGRLDARHASLDSAADRARRRDVRRPRRIRCVLWGVARPCRTRSGGATTR